MAPGGVVDLARAGSLNQESIRIAMRLSVAIVLFIVAAAHAASRPHEWKAINYAPRGHPYFVCSTTGSARMRQQAWKFGRWPMPIWPRLRRSGFKRGPFVPVGSAYIRRFPPRACNQDSGNVGLRLFRSSVIGEPPMGGPGRVHRHGGEHNIWVPPGRVRMDERGQIPRLRLARHDAPSRRRPLCAGIHTAADVTLIAPAVQALGSGSPAKCAEKAMKCRAAAQRRREPVSSASATRSGRIRQSYATSRKRGLSRPRGKVGSGWPPFLHQAWAKIDQVLAGIMRSAVSWLLLVPMGRF